VLDLVSANGPSRATLGGGAGHFALTRIYETEGVQLGDATPEDVAAAWDKIADNAQQTELQNAFEQTRKFAKSAAQAKGLNLTW